MNHRRRHRGIHFVIRSVGNDIAAISRHLALSLLAAFLLMAARPAYAMEGETRLMAAAGINQELTFDLQVGAGYLVTDFWELTVAIQYIDGVFAAGGAVVYNIDYFTFIPSLYVGVTQGLHPRFTTYVPLGIQLDWRPTTSWYIGVGAAAWIPLNEESSIPLYYIRTGWYL